LTPVWLVAAEQAEPDESRVLAPVGRVLLPDEPGVVGLVELGELPDAAQAELDESPVSVLVEQLELRILQQAEPAALLAAEQVEAEQVELRFSALVELDALRARLQAAEVLRMGSGGLQVALDVLRDALPSLPESHCRAESDREPPRESRQARCDLYSEVAAQRPWQVFRDLRWPTAIGLY
jgi:hypothetical protein